MPTRSHLLADGWDRWISDNVKLVEQDIRSLANAPRYLLKDAEPPSMPGVYLFSQNSETLYAGEAKSDGRLFERHSAQTLIWKRQAPPATSIHARLSRP